MVSPGSGVPGGEPGRAARAEQLGRPSGDTLLRTAPCPVTLVVIGRPRRGLLTRLSLGTSPVASSRPPARGWIENPIGTGWLSTHDVDMAFADQPTIAMLSLISVEPIR